MGRGACQQNFGILRPFPPCPKTHASSLRGHHLLRSHNFRDFGPPPPLFAVSRNISVLLFAKLATSLSANVINGSVINRSMIWPMLRHYYSAEAESCFGWSLKWIAPYYVHFWGYPLPPSVRTRTYLMHGPLLEELPRCNTRPPCISV